MAPKGRELGMIDVNMDFITNVLVYGAAFGLLYICTWHHNQFDAYRGITRKQFYYRLGFIILIEAIYINILFIQGSQDASHVLSTFLQNNGSDMRHVCDYALDFLILSSWAQRYSLYFKEKGWVVPLLLLWCFFDLTANSFIPSAAAVKVVVFAIISLGALILPKDPVIVATTEQESQQGNKRRNKKKGKK